MSDADSSRPSPRSVGTAAATARPRSQPPGRDGARRALHRASTRPAVSLEDLALLAGRRLREARVELGQCVRQRLPGGTLEQRRELEQLEIAHDGMGDVEVGVEAQLAEASADAGDRLQQLSRAARKLACRLLSRSEQLLRARLPLDAEGAARSSANAKAAAPLRLPSARRTRARGVRAPRVIATCTSRRIEATCPSRVSGGSCSASSASGIGSTARERAPGRAPTGARARTRSRTRGHARRPSASRAHRRPCARRRLRRRGPVARPRPPRPRSAQIRAVSPAAIGARRPRRARRSARARRAARRRRAGPRRLLAPQPETFDQLCTNRSGPRRVERRGRGAMQLEKAQHALARLRWAAAATRSPRPAPRPMSQAPAGERSGCSARDRSRAARSAGGRGARTAAPRSAGSTSSAATRAGREPPAAGNGLAPPISVCGTARSLERDGDRGALAADRADEYATALGRHRLAADQALELRARPVPGRARTDSARRRPRPARGRPVPGRRGGAASPSARSPSPRSLSVPAPSPRSPSARSPPAVALRARAFPRGRPPAVALPALALRALGSPALALPAVRLRPAPSVLRSPRSGRRPPGATRAIARRAAQASPPVAGSRRSVEAPAQLLRVALGGATQTRDRLVGVRGREQLRCAPTRQDDVELCI